MFAHTKDHSNAKKASIISNSNIITRIYLPKIPNGDFTASFG